ncbi:MAG: GNAT family N-acetyltransferase [Acidimicrobiales bacterium]
MIVDFHRVPAPEVGAADLHDILRLRGDIFVVEQQCAYADIDGRDLDTGTTHHWFRDPSGIAAALRTLDGTDGVARIGRVVTRPDVRGRGLSARLVVGALAGIDGPAMVRAQAHLEHWYARFGFDAGAVPDRFTEDGIPHVVMMRPAGPQPVHVDSADIDDPALVELVAELLHDLRSRYPGMTDVESPAEIVEGWGRFVVVRVDGVPAGCGAVRRLPDGRAELKRMYVRPEMRGRGLVQLLLAAVDALAAEAGYDALYLVAGDRQPEAVAAYRREGFVDAAPWGRWVDIPQAVCMMRPIDRAQGGEEA